VRLLCHGTDFLLVFVCRLQWIICQNVTSRLLERTSHIAYLTQPSNHVIILNCYLIIIHRQRSLMVVINRTRKDRLAMRTPMCYCPCYSQSRCTVRCTKRPLYTRTIMRYASMHTKCVKYATGWIIAHRQRNKHLTWNSYSGSSKVIHLEITEKPSRDCICCIHIGLLDILCKVSEHIASNRRWKSRSSTTSLSFDAPSPRNPSEYPHIPDISRNRKHWSTFRRW